jgi:hypothetical protein
LLRSLFSFICASTSARQTVIPVSAYAKEHCGAAGVGVIVNVVVVRIANWHSVLNLGTTLEEVVASGAVKNELTTALRVVEVAISEALLGALPFLSEVRSA